MVIGDLFSFAFFRRLCAYPKGRNVNYLSLFLDVVDSESLPSGWSRYVKIRLTVVKQVSEEHSVIKGDS